MTPEGAGTRMRRLFALLLIIAGTAFLFMDVANVWGRLALACWCYTAAFRHIAREPGVREHLGPDAAIQGWAIGSIVASVLFGIASYQLHEPIGWLFMFLSLRFGLWAAWALRATEAARLQEKSSDLRPMGSSVPQIYGPSEDEP